MSRGIVRCDRNMCQDERTLSQTISMIIAGFVSMLYSNFKDGSGKKKKEKKKKEPSETHKIEERNKGKLLPFSHHPICLNNSNLSRGIALCIFSSLPHSVFFFFSLPFAHFSSLSGCARAKSSLEEMSEFVGGQ